MQVRGVILALGPGGTTPKQADDQEEKKGYLATTPRAAACRDGRVNRMIGAEVVRGALGFRYMVSSAFHYTTSAVAGARVPAPVGSTRVG